MFCSVPRILNKVHGKIMDGVNNSSATKQWLFNKALNAKKYYLENNGAFTHRFYDAVVFKKVR